MKLDKHIVDMFTELTKPADDVKMEKTCYGTISVVDGTRYVKLDGSDLLVPAASTVKTSHGDRVTVLMKNHSLTVTGNLTAPATDGEGGSSGEAGTAATIEVGTVTTGEAGSSASVTNVGTTSAAVFDFVIPRGDKGEKGDAGPQGPQGEKGDTGTWDGTIPDHEHTVSDITDFPTSLPANGGNAETLDGKHASDFKPYYSYAPIFTGNILDITEMGTYSCSVPECTNLPSEITSWCYITMYQFRDAGYKRFICTKLNTIGSNDSGTIYLASESYKDADGNLIWSRACDGGNANSVQGYSPKDSGTKGLPAITSDYGPIEIGKYLDFHTSDGQDYKVRITANDDGTISFTGAIVGNITGTLDGKHASDFMQWLGYIRDVDFLNNANYKVNYHCNIDDGTIIGLPIAGWYHVVYYMHFYSNGYGMQIAYPLNFDGATMIRRANGTTWGTWKNIADGGNADTLDGLHANEIASNPNLLINPDFKINQRGLTEYSGDTNYVYTVDGWRVGFGNGTAKSLKVESDGIVFGSSTDRQYLVQIIETPERLIGDYTLAFCISEITGSAVIQFVDNDEVSSSKVISEPGVYSVTRTLGGIEATRGIRLQLRSEVGATVKARWAKLELGSVATPFVPPDPATELAKCQRYYQIRSTGNIPAVDLRPSMRATPTVTRLSDGNYAYGAEL